MSTAEIPHLLSALLQQAKQHPDEVALLDSRTGDAACTWGELARMVSATANTLQTQFPWTAAPKRLTYRCTNHLSEVVLSLACIAAGVTEIPIDAFLPKPQQETLIQRSKALHWDHDRRGHHEHHHALTRSTSLREAISNLEASAREVDLHSPSVVLWTSGTTAQPRGVMLSQHNLTTNAKAKLLAVPQRTSDLRLSLLSIAHAYARTSDMGTWLLSGCRWSLGRGRSTLHSLPETLSPTLINAVPVLIHDMLNRIESGQSNLQSLRLLGCGGVAMSSEQFERCLRNNIGVIQGYGCTETSPVICSASPDNARPNRVGPLVAGWEAKVEHGRLFVRGPGVMLGYLDDEAATQQKISPDGWLDTGDLVEIHDDQLQILGRADDVIVLDNGFKVFPATIERQLLQLEGIEQAVLLHHQGQLWLLLSHDQPQTTADAPTGRDPVESRLAESLPPGTSVKRLKLSEPLSIETGELTAKGTPRRHIIHQRRLSTNDSFDGGNQAGS
ncbi:class I adenylate-forming enzyme family protein [Rhodopirellula sp. P2]|uniref:class I adenylate-forming enzyme family protein n=1 Tax=Rhodopirellula sp. P2 TaxID=2127060 RepID=UPI0023676D2A|nr:long-chain fatty acid--CoA ligase [Rhodopirellula sp. P2]WDQ18222.1 long-chain fatty acid--CoA ligase [Rhodopirellula sp. P2]